MSTRMKASYFIAAFTGLLFLSATVKGQHSISGKVISEDGSPLIGAVVQLLPAAQAKTTDQNGEFFFTSVADRNVTLKVSLVGYVTQEITPVNTNKLTIVLKEDVRQLQEAVIYGKSETAAAREMSVKAEVLDLKQSHTLPVNISELMNRSAGIRVRQTGGLGSATDISLNGFQGKSIRYFKDGVPMDYLGEGFSLSSLPVNMLDRVEIYKGVLPVHLGADALGGGVNLITRKTTRNIADVSYEAGSYGTHRANLNAHFTRKNSFYGADAFFNRSDNNYKVNVKVTDPETRNQEDATLPLFNNAFTGYFGQVFFGLRNLTWADELRVDLSGFKFNRQQQHPALMTEPYGKILARQSSLIPSLKYEKQFDRLGVNQFLAYNTLTINRTDTLKGAYDWFGNFTPNPYKTGESRQPSLSDVETRFLTSRTHIKYRLGAHHSLEANQVLTRAVRSGKDPYGPKFADTDVDVLTLPLEYLKSISSLGLNLVYGPWENLLMGKYFRFTSNGIETYQSREINTSEATTIRGNTWGIANAVKYKVSDHSLVRLSAEYSSRLPDHNEIFGDAVWIVQNFGIKPERSLNTNLGWRTAKRDRFAVELNTFYRRTRDMILLVPIQAPYARFENQQHVKGFGWEADGSVTVFSRFTINANATFQDMRLFGISNTQEAWKNEARLRNTPYLFGNLGVNYQSKPVFGEKATLRAFAFYSYLHEYYLETIPRRLEGKGFFGKAQVNSQLVIPNQHLLNAGFLIALPEQKMSLGFDIKNLLNRPIYDNYRVQRAGRSLHLKISYSFL